LLKVADAPTAEDLERADALKRLARGSLWRRVPISTIRLELGDLAGEWVVLAVPTMRVIGTFEFKAVAELVLKHLTEWNVERRRDLTRPGGTCPSCSGPLMPPTRPEPRRRDHMGWCAACAKYVVPAGARE